MKIDFFLASQEDGERVYVPFKTIEMDFIPQKDFKYIDVDTKGVYNVGLTVFSDNKISVIVNGEADALTFDAFEKVVS